MNKQTKSYADYVKEGNRFNPAYLAPLTAMPKSTKGDNPRYRFKCETIKARDGILVKQLYIPKRGFLVHKIKEIK